MDLPAIEGCPDIETAFSQRTVVFAGPRGHKFAITRREQRTARRPPNAPETVAAEKNSAARIPNSDRLYQLQGQEAARTQLVTNSSPARKDEDDSGEGREQGTEGRTEGGEGGDCGDAENWGGVRI